MMSTGTMECDVNSRAAGWPVHHRFSPANTVDSTESKQLAWQQSTHMHPSAVWDTVRPQCGEARTHQTSSGHSSCRSHSSSGHQRRQEWLPHAGWGRTHGERPAACHPRSPSLLYLHKQETSCLSSKTVPSDLRQ